MKIIGLTGSIASGKSTMTRMLKRMRIPVHDSDACVHHLLKPNGQATTIIGALFPDCCDKKGGIDRQKLGQLIFEDQPELRPLVESILHPLVRQETNHFINLCQRQRRKICVVDIPLLFETNSANRFDSIWCLTVPKTVQKRRLMARAYMTPAKSRAILRAQWPQRKKTIASDLVFPSARGYNHVIRKIKSVLR